MNARRPESPADEAAQALSGSGGPKTDYDGGALRGTKGNRTDKG